MTHGTEWQVTKMKIDKKTGLRECPFCGSTDIKMRNGSNRYWLVCDDCRTEGPTPRYDLWETPEDAIAAWNMRYDPEGDDQKMNTPELTIKEVSPEEHYAELKKELKSGLFEAITARCDNIYEECGDMNYISKGCVTEQLIEILDLVKMSEYLEEDDGK